MKKCPSCNQIKEIGLNSARHDGLGVYCKDCLMILNKVKYAKTGITKPCLRCSNLFFGLKHARYCKNCIGTLKMKPITGYKNCLFCNKSFPYRDTLLVRGDGPIKSIKSKFCSKKCSTTYKNKTAICTPEQLKRKSEVTRRTFKGKKLSKERRIRMSKYWSGSNSHFWKGGVTNKNMILRESVDFSLWRESVFKRDDYTCQRCKQRGGKLQAHHIKRFSDYPELRFDINNGQTLCKSCHKLTDNYGRRNTKILIK